MLMKRLYWRSRRAFRLLTYTYLEGFVFIHINKTGGSSIEKALNIPFEHKTALEKIEEIGPRRWNRKLSFTVVRNPWDKVVSHYHYRVKTNQTGLGQTPIGFNEWVKRAYGDQDPQYYDIPKMFMPQVQWIRDHSGNILVDEIIHFEDLENEFRQILDKLGKNVELPHEKKTDRSHYHEYYDQAAIETIRAWFKEDIESFGYHY